jgi:large subunit ribosomal protein L24
MKIHIKKGDTVEVIAGDDKSTTEKRSIGKVLKVERKKYRAFVEGMNMVSKGTKPNAKNPQGGIIQKEASIHISNLMLVDGKGNATRIGRRKDDNGKLVRYSKKTGEEIK